MYRRTISELVSLYLLEPELTDVWVEGPSDQSVISWYLGGTSDAKVEVRTIEEVEVGTEILEKYGLTSGNRNRLLVLAFELDKPLGAQASATYVALADKDFDGHLKQEFTSPCLIFTDFCSLEGYLFDAPTLDKFFKLCLGDGKTNVDDVMSAISKAGESLFFARLANEKLSWGMRWISYDKLLTDSDAYVRVDFDTFCERYLQANGRIASIDEFFGVIADARVGKKVDARCQINGHDLLQLLYWPRRQSFKSRSDMERALRGCIEFDRLREFSLFQELSARCN